MHACVHVCMCACALACMHSCVHCCHFNNCTTINLIFLVLFLMLVFALITIFFFFFRCVRVRLDVHPWASRPLLALHKGRRTKWQPCLIGLKRSVTLKRCKLPLGQKQRESRPSTHGPRWPPGVTPPSDGPLIPINLCGERPCFPNQNVEGPRGRFTVLFCCFPLAPPLRQGRKKRGLTARMLQWMQPTCVECLRVQGGTNCRVQTLRS